MRILGPPGDPLLSRSTRALLRQTPLHGLAHERHVPYLAGWLRKKGQQRRSWERRWFVLCGGFLMYFESPHARMLNTRGVRE